MIRAEVCFRFNELGLPDELLPSRVPGGEAKGRIVFGSEFPDPRMRMGPQWDDPRPVEFGGYEIDFSPLSCEANDAESPKAKRARSNPRGVGSISADGRVEIGFDPNVDHGPLSLVGQINGDVIRGNWILRGTRVEGRFVMRRRAP